MLQLNLAQDSLHGVKTNQIEKLVGSQRIVPQALTAYCHCSWLPSGCDVRPYWWRQYMPEWQNTETSICYRHGSFTPTAKLSELWESHQHKRNEIINLTSCESCELQEWLSWQNIPTSTVLANSCLVQTWLKSHDCLGNNIILLFC